MENNEVISIIVPVYKVEDYIRRCIDSLLTQTYMNTQIILVDDGSPDMCGRICDEYAATDTRIQVIHKENGGLSDARNAGLLAAKGEYIAFVDSDDWVAPDYLERMYEALCKQNADICECSVQRTSDEVLSVKTADASEKVFGTESALAELIQDGVFRQHVWNKLYKKEIIDTYNICMDESLQWCEDFVFNLEYVLHADTIAALPVPVYYYVKTEGSLVAKNLSLTKIVQMKSILIFTVKYLTIIKNHYFGFI